MEINGLFNIKLILDHLEHELVQLRSTHRDEIAKIREQLDLLERYMIAYGFAANFEELPPPIWHEVKADPQSYKLNRER